MPTLWSHRAVLLLAGSLLLAPVLRAQCSDCLVPSSDGPTVLSPSRGEASAPERARAQAGDATAVSISSWSAPGSTINTPTAYGAEWGQVFAGVSYQHRIRYSDWHDGILVVGVGAGNPRRTVGLSATVSILDTYTEFAKDRSLSLKLHRQLPLRSAVAVGYENVWRTRGTDGGASRYAVASTVLPLRDDPTGPLGALVLSAGLGDDRFLSEPRFARGERGVNAFGSLGLRLLRPLSGIVNWSGQDLNLGLSVVPVRGAPVVVTPALLDVTGRAGDGARVAIAASVRYDARP